MSLKFPTGSPREYHADACAPCKSGCMDCMETVIHKLSQPLTCLRGSLELALLGEGSPGAYREAIEEALAHADRLFRLLDLFRELTAGAATSGGHSPVGLRDLVLGALDDVRAFVESRGLRVTFDSEGDLEVRTDAQRLRDAIVKMMRSIVERTPREGHLKVLVSRLDGLASLIISDHDHTPPSPGEKSLEGFYLREFKFGGLQKGCDFEWTVARQVIHALGGTVQFSNGARKGCCLQILLPLAGEKAA